LALRKLDTLVHEHFGQFPNAESYIRFVFPNILRPPALILSSFKVSRSCRT
jgi:hypothetical protein